MLKSLGFPCQVLKMCLRQLVGGNTRVSVLALLFRPSHFWTIQGSYFSSLGKSSRVVQDLTVLEGGLYVREKKQNIDLGTSGSKLRNANI